MRTLNIGTQEHTKVVCLDQPADGGACHEYAVYEAVVEKDEDCRSFAKVIFQKGPVKEAGVNGCHQEDLIAIVIDRLEHFQKGEYACKLNEDAMGFFKLGLDMLRSRTDARKDRGVEGTSAV